MFICSSAGMVAAQNMQAAVSGTRLAEALVGTEESDSKELPLISTGSQHLVPGALPVARPSSSLPRVFAPTRPRTTYTRFPWKRNIVTTVFWVGETPTRNNPTPNTVSAWDMNWTANYGGFDTPKVSGRDGYRPKDFIPRQNPFYFALPYNDITRTGTKASARAMIPWFKKKFYRSGRTVLKGRWIAIRKGDQVCYAQWEDVGPFETDNYEYVFGDARPRTKGNGGAGLDVSPAVKDYLGFSTRAICDWRFVDLDEVPDGPWKTWGSNNPFATNSPEVGSSSDSIVKVRELRDRIAAGEVETDLPTDTEEEDQTPEGDSPKASADSVE